MGRCPDCRRPSGLRQPDDALARDRTPTDHGQENPVRVSEQSARMASWFGVSGSH